MLNHKTKKCPRCEGRGWFDNGLHFPQCTKCSGTGRIEKEYVEEKCPECRGSGWGARYIDSIDMNEQCFKCHGTGTIKVKC